MSTLIMKAAIRYKYCNPDELMIAEVPAPIPGTSEILVKVKATTVNRTDCAVLTGKPWIMRCFTGISKPVRPIRAGRLIELLRLLVKATMI